MSNCSWAIFTYHFRAESFESGWYHSHVSVKYADGLFGPMVVDGPSQRPYNIDLGPVILTDDIYTSYLKVLRQGLGVTLVFSTISNSLTTGRGATNGHSAINEIKCSPEAHLESFPSKLERPIDYDW
ncbi:hypothetical protein DSL72_003877 [Monilinia vaccinii-corymbosi]|uniref:Plastocyanin-like domain-containing protein n=1 Tax=Monilinia vaccinii-corymbosi TaxID=61207 RepID=A0A8A3NV60_9HELO|nr:hypothetical protein DSL72_003877 [Monilinia vaccinii-corymbosi]